MSSNSARSLEQPPRKKIRKGTRSCWECKHRKVRCLFSESNSSTCRECLSRGLACQSQDLPEPENLRESDRSSVNDRLSRVESLLERVLQRLDTGIIPERPPSPSLIGHRSRTSSPPVITPTAQESAPVMSLFNNSLLGLHRPDSEHHRPISNGVDPELNKLRMGLLGLLPPQSTVDKLAQQNNCWWLIRMQCFGDANTSLLPEPVESLSKRHPVAIAKALFWVTICLQQLPPSFDVASLDLPFPRDQYIEQCVTMITTLVCSHETLVRSVDGLECLVLQAVFYNNDGKLRRAWVSYRNAQNVAQLLGLHRPVAKEGTEYLAHAKKIWRHILFADRYLSLMLGMCHGAFDAALDTQPTADYMNKLFVAAGSLIERNQQFTNCSPAMIRKTQLLDAELAESNPGVINANPVESTTTTKTTEIAQQYANLMARLWHFQLVAWLHLPLMLDSSTQHRYEYNRQCCLDASRNMITCYIAIRKLTGESFCCKSLDFQAFTAAVTLLINMLRPENRRQPTGEDLEATNNVVETLQRLATSQPDDVASRALGVLQTLKSLLLGETGSDRIAEDGSAGLKLSIPYFGTIFLDRSVSQPTTEPDPNIVGGADVSYLQAENHATSISQPIDDTSLLYPAVTGSEEQSYGLWSFDPGLTTQFYLSADFCGDLDWEL